MQFPNLKINWFELVYLAIAIATFQHTTWAAATVFEGAAPQDPIALNWWYFKGSLLAVAIDIGMLVAARELRKKWNWVMVIAFVIAAIASFYTQILFSLAHTSEFKLAAGVSSYWEEFLDPLIQARVVLVPAMLPLFAIIFTITPIFAEKEVIRQEQKANAKPYEFHGARKSWSFSSATERDQFAKLYARKREKQGKPILLPETTDLGDENYKVVAITTNGSNGAEIKIG